MGNSQLAKAKAPLPTEAVREFKKEFAQLKKQYGWKDDEQYILMNRQIMYTGSRDEIIANYDNFIQKNILGGQNAEISIPLGVYNHYSDYFNHTILECFNQLNHTNPYNDDFELQKKCQDGINEWLLIAYMNCRSCKEKNAYSVRFMFQVSVYTRVDKKAEQQLNEIAKQQRIQDQQQIAAAGNDDNKAPEKEIYKIQIPQPLTDDELTQFERKFKKYICDYGWKKEEIFILMDRQVLHTGTHDDIVPKYVDFFEKVVFGDKNSDHSMPTGVYDHFLGALTNTIENSLSQVDDEDINEYKDTFKLQQKLDDGEREWLLIALLSCNIATKPSKTKFYVRYAIQVGVYSRVDTTMKQLQNLIKDDKIKKAQQDILNQVKQQQDAENNAQEGGFVETAYIDVIDYAAIGLNNDKQNDDKKYDQNDKPKDKLPENDEPNDNKEAALAAKKRGNAHYSKQEWDLAIKEFTEAIKLYDSDHSFYSNRSACYAATDKFDKALSDGKKCVELKPDWAKGYGRVGYAYFKLNKLDEAKQAYENGLKIDGNNLTLKDGLAQCERRFNINPGALQFDNNVNHGNPTDEVKQHDDVETKEGLVDDAWSMNEEYSAWSCEDLANWIGILDEDFAEKYVDTFVDKELNGRNFKNFKSEHYLISNLGMTKNDAEQFAKIVKNRIEGKDKLVAANEAPWTCKSCSFENDPQVEKCKICEKQGY